MDMEVEKLYTMELKKVLTNMSKDILNDYPAKKITTEHFILALLTAKQSSVYKVLNRFLLASTIQGIYDFYAKHLHEKIQILQPNNKREIGYDNKLTQFLIDSVSEKEKLKDPKIGTEHVFLSILSTDNIIKKTFETISVTYDIFYNEIETIRLEEVNDKAAKQDLVESISGFKSKTSKKTMVEQYCVSLNKLVQQGKIDELIGRKNEVDRLIKILGRRNKSNVILVGLGGVGKSAIVSGIASMIEANNAMFLNGKTILSLNMTAIIAGTMYRGQLEERMNGVINEIKANKDYILFIDDIHTVLGNNTGNSNEIAGILSNALSNDDIKLIATTTFKEYKNSIENNPALSRRFQKIAVEPTSVKETEEILFKSKSYYEKFHNVSYSDEAIKACAYLANKYITERQLPDSAIDIMDECGSNKKIYNDNSNELVELKKKLSLNETLRDKSMKINDFELGDQYNKKCKEIKLEIVDFEKKIRSETTNNAKKITEEDIYLIVSDMTGIPINKLSASDKKKYLEIENILNQSVIGQEDAVKMVAQSVKRSRLGIGRHNRPNSVLFFLGESSTGKTLLAKKLAEEIFGSEKYLIKFDMSEYSDKTSVNKLIGSSPGYIMADQGGLLTEAIKNNPYCVLLLDEIEKADKEVYNTFLQVFDEGYLSDNTGVRVSFKNVIIIMTSNIGAKDANSFARSPGFQSNSEDNKKNITDKALKSHFSPEFINRIDRIIYFNHLNEENLKKIIKLELNNLNKRLNEIEFNVEYNDDLIEYIYDFIGNDKQTGARKINRAIQDEIESKICDLYLENDYEKQYTFKITIEENNLKIK